MKKITLIILLAIANICSFGQSRQDKAQILQLCIDIPELQQYYPLDAEGNPMQIAVLQHGVSFDMAIEVSKFGRPLQFLDKNEISVLGLSSYFLFWTFKIEENMAHIDYVYNYMDADNQPKIHNVILDMQKLNGRWIVINSKIERK